MVEKIKSADWRSFILIFLCGVFLGVSFFKVPPAIPTLMAYFQCSVADAGWMMSWCSVAGTIIAFFTGSIQSKIGPKAMVIGAMGFTLLSIVVGLFAPTIEIFMVSQFIGGLGNGFIATGAPTLITVLFKDPSKRGLPNSIWATWTACGSLIMLNVFALIISAFGTWQSVWVFSLIVVAIITVIAAFGIKVDKAEAMSVAQGSADVKLSKGLTNPYVILLCILFICFAFGFSVWAAMAPTYMQAVVGLDMATANSLSSITTITGIIGSLIVGVILNKCKNQPGVMLVVMILVGIVMCLELVFTTPFSMVVIAILVGLVLNAAPPCFFSNVQWASPDPSVMGAAFGVLAIGANLGGIPAANTIGAIVDATQGN
ncbi:MAG: MFS transporter, partial [Raoultibacter sp.]